MGMRIALGTVDVRNEVEQWVTIKHHQPGAETDRQWNVRMRAIIKDLLLQGVEAVQVGEAAALEEHHQGRPSLNEMLWPGTDRTD